MMDKDTVTLANLHLAVTEIGDAQALLGRVLARGPGDRSDAARGRAAALLEAAAHRIRTGESVVPVRRETWATQETERPAAAVPAAVAAAVPVAAPESAA